MIDSDDFLMTKRGFLKANELAEGDIVLGIQNGQKKWATIKRILLSNGNAIRVYGEQCEFTVFSESIVITDKGPQMLFKEIESANIYETNPKLPKAFIETPDFGNSISSRGEFNDQDGVLERIDIRLLALLCRRLPGEKKIVIKMQRNQVERIKDLFQNVRAARVVGDLWDWIAIDSDILVEIVRKWWPIPTVIPRFIRQLPPVKLAEFCKTLLSCVAVPKENAEEDQKITYWTFEDERDVRQMIYQFLTAKQVDYKMSYTPLYSPHICEISSYKSRMRISNVVKTSRRIGSRQGLSIFSSMQNWYPIVNLTPFYSALYKD